MNLFFFLFLSIWYSELTNRDTDTFAYMQWVMCISRINNSKTGNSSNRSPSFTFKHPIQETPSTSESTYSQFAQQSTHPSWMVLMLCVKQQPFCCFWTVMLLDFSVHKESSCVITHHPTGKLTSALVCNLSCVTPASHLWLTNTQT